MHHSGWSIPSGHRHKNIERLGRGVAGYNSKTKVANGALARWPRSTIIVKSPAGVSPLDAQVLTACDWTDLLNDRGLALKGQWHGPSSFPVISLLGGSVITAEQANERDREKKQGLGGGMIRSPPASPLPASAREATSTPSRRRFWLVQAKSV
jgi:hypothetical protein